MKPLKDFLVGLQASKFWGEVTIRFIDGRPTTIFKQEKIKLSNNPEEVSRKNHHCFHAPQESGHGINDFSAK